MKKEFAEKAVNKGIFRIGTLYEFQNIEKHGCAIGDSEEGKKYFQNRPNEIYDFSKPETIPDFTRKFIKAPDGANIKFDNCLFQEEVSSPDLFIYSVSQEISKESLKSLDYDSVIIINYPKKFFHALSSCLRKKILIKPGCIISPCSYINRASHFEYPNHLHPALIKDPTYKYQKEVRAIWESPKLPLKPLIINCKVAKKFCSLLTDSKLKYLMKT